MQSEIGNAALNTGRPFYFFGVKQVLSPEYLVNRGDAVCGEESVRPVLGHA